MQSSFWDFGDEAFLLRGKRNDYLKRAGKEGQALNYPFLVTAAFAVTLQTFIIINSMAIRNIPDFLYLPVVPRRALSAW